MERTILLRLDNVDRSYIEGKQETLGVFDVSFTVATGEVVALVGPSGCGKTTILKMIAGILEPTKGEITCSGRNVYEARQQGRIGYVPQHSTLLPFKTVVENIELPLGLQGRCDDARIEELLRIFNLSSYRHFYPRLLSGGMQQRVAIARALAGNPEILLMDEPFASVDELLKEKLNEELLRVHVAFGTTILYVTHNLEEAVFLADRVLVLSPAPGTIVADLSMALPKERLNALRTDPAFFAEVVKVRAALRDV